MKAMIFAAGLGTRLMPLTSNKPKALVEVRGKPLLQIQIEKLISLGVDEFIVNVHHFADQVVTFLKSHDNFGVRIEVSDESRQLLDTGGGIKQTSWFFDDGKPFLVHNVDVLTDLDIQGMMKRHTDTGALVTLAVRNRSTSRYLLFDDELRLCGWLNDQSGEEIFVHRKENLQRLAFSGIHCLDPAVFKQISENGKFSIINTYLRLAKNNEIKAFIHNDSFWKDVGKPQDLEDAANNPTIIL